MRAILIKTTCAATFYMATLTVDAQTNFPKYEAGINIGAFVYQGDLTPQKLGSLKTPTLTLSIYGNRILNSSFSLRTNLVLGKLKGDDAKYSNPAYRQQRNFRFKTPVIELSQLMVWNIRGTNFVTKDSYGEKDKLGFSPYVMAGGGLTYLRIRRDWSSFNQAYFVNDPKLLTGLANDAQHDPPRFIPIIPVGAGLRYSLSQKLAINLEAMYRFTFTDYLDGFSEAANPDKKDSYYSVTIGLMYRFGLKNMLNCPIIRD